MNIDYEPVVSWLFVSRICTNGQKESYYLVHFLVRKKIRRRRCWLFFINTIQCKRSRKERPVQRLTMHTYIIVFVLEWHITPSLITFKNTCNLISIVPGTNSPPRRTDKYSVTQNKNWKWQHAIFLQTFITVNHQATFVQLISLTTAYESGLFPKAHAK